MFNEIINPLNSTKLFGHKNYFKRLINMYNLKKFPKISLFSGEKGVGKFTLINHFLNYIFDKNSYDLKNQTIDNKSLIYKSIVNFNFENMILVGKDNEKIGIDTIRKLKETISKTTISDLPRFIILDNIDQFNINCSNALLKIIEEPSNNNYFILIDNKKKKLVDTIVSRCIKTNLYITKEERYDITSSLISEHSLELILNLENSNLTPGTFLTYNNIALENNIQEEVNYIDKINILLKLYKKNKDLNLIALSIHYTDEYFYSLSKNYSDIVNLNNNKIKIIKNIYNYVNLNLNLNSVLNNINSQFSYGK